VVGGTALSLLLGHRMSVDIDMFTDKEYGTTDFGVIETPVRGAFAYVENTDDRVPGLRNLENNYGLHLYVGLSEDEPIKTDILYWDTEYVYDMIKEDGIRLASLEEIAAMKLDAISRGGRKKDFWDLVELMDTFTLQEMLDTYQPKYPYNAIQDVYRGLSDFSTAEEVPDPICLRGRNWEDIKAQVLAELKKVHDEGTLDFSIGNE